jgi:hypothetical protein
LVHTERWCGQHGRVWRRAAQAPLGSTRRAAAGTRVNGIIEKHTFHCRVSHSLVYFCGLGALLWAACCLSPPKTKKRKDKKTNKNAFGVPLETP